MRKRYGCNLVDRTITSFLWCARSQAGRLTRLLSVPSRVCILVSLIYYAMSASCVAAVMHTTNTWRNHTDAGTQDTEAVQMKTILRSGKLVQSEYTVLTVSDVEDRDQPDCMVSENDSEYDRAQDSTSTDGDGNRKYESSELTPELSSTPASATTIADRVGRLVGDHAKFYREMRPECSKFHNSTRRESDLRRLHAALSRRSLPFCSRYLLAHVLTSSCLRSDCEDCVLSVVESDATAEIEYARFMRFSYSFDGALWPTSSMTTLAQSFIEPQLVLGDECLVLYKDWLCASYLPLFFEYDFGKLSSSAKSNDEEDKEKKKEIEREEYKHKYKDAFRVLPCVEVCRQVEEKCPFFVPDPDDGSGDPAFVCGHLVESNRFGHYSFDACFVPSCHLEELRSVYSQRRSTCSSSNAYVDEASSGASRNASTPSPPVAAPRCAPLTRDLDVSSRAVLDLSSLLLAPPDQDASRTATEDVVRARVELIPSGSPVQSAASWFTVCIALTAARFAALAKY